MKHIKSYHSFLFEDLSFFSDLFSGTTTELDAETKELIASTELLKFGSSGPHVRTLQKHLGLPITGKYDEQTEKTVEEFQQDPNNKDSSGSRLRVDGVVGPKTKEAMFKIKPKGPPTVFLGGTGAPNLSGGFVIRDRAGSLNLEQIASRSIDGRPALSMNPGFGKGKGFGDAEKKRYLQLISHPGVHWAIANCSGGKIVGASDNAGSNLYGASVPKILIAAAALNNNGGRFTGSVLGSPEVEWKNLINLIVKSENQPAWKKVQEVAGGANGVRQFCSKMGYSTMQPQHPTGQINALEMVRFYCDMVNGRFAGADALLKVSHAITTAGSRSKVYIPTGTPMGGKTGTWSNYNHDTGWLQWGGQFWSIAVLTDSRVAGKLSSKDVAIVWGGLFDQWIAKTKG